jgi:hypothetical protein
MEEWEGEVWSGIQVGGQSGNFPLSNGQLLLQTMQLLLSDVCRWEDPSRVLVDYSCGIGVEGRSKAMLECY